MTRTAEPGEQLRIEVRNPVGIPAGAPPASAGAGLMGLGERAELASGVLEFGVEEGGAGADGGDFAVRARLPWPVWARYGSGCCSWTTIRWCRPVCG